MTTSPTTDRRPLASRSTRWAGFLASKLAATPITPNQISLLSIAFAFMGGALTAFGTGAGSWLAAALCVQLRLLCNLLDGMVAVEGGKGTPAGALYNEIPDRVADSLFLIGAGYAVGLPWLGWLAALLAVATAYVRAFGASLGFGQDFSGLMSKPRRMAALTLGLICASIESSSFETRFSLQFALLVIALGTLHTCWARTRNVHRRLEQA